MRIATLILTLRVGGAQRTATTLVNHWASQGHVVHFLTYDKPDAPAHFPLDPRVTVQGLDLEKDSRSVRQGLRNNLRRVATVRRALRVIRPDVLVCHMDRENIVGLVAAQGLGIPVVIRSAADPSGSGIGPAWEALRRLIYPLADAFVLQSERSLVYYSAWVRGRSTVIPNPVFPPKPAAGATIHLPRPCIICVASFQEPKNQAMIVRAFATVSATMRSWTLVFVGDGTDRTAVEALAKELGVAERTVFLGIVNDVPQLLQQADIFALSSRSEGFPNALAEAMAYGVPPISTDCPTGPRELIRDGVDGLLVPVDDEAAMARALVQLSSDAELRARLGQGSRQVVDRFPITATLARWDEILQRVARHPKVP